MVPFNINCEKAKPQDYDSDDGQEGVLREPCFSIENKSVRVKKLRFCFTWTNRFATRELLQVVVLCNM